MVERYFLRLNNIIIGPFTRRELLQKIKQEHLSASTDTSVDKITWYPLHKALNLIIPEENIIIPDVNDNYKNTDQVPEAPQQPDLITGQQYYQTAYNLQCNEIPMDPAQDQSVMRIIADTIGSLGNGSGYLQKLWQKGSGAMIGSGMLALFLSLLLTILSGILFASRYDFPRLGFYLRSVVCILLSGGVFWLFNLLIRLIAPANQRSFSNEADFLTAMHGMLNTALLALLASGILWMFTNAAVELPSSVTSAAIIFSALVLGFFLSNVLVSLRVNFFDGCTLGAGWSTFWAFIELWLVFMLWFLIMKPVYL